MEKKKIMSIAGALIGVLAFFAIKYALTPVLGDIKINKELKEAAEAENSKCPNTIGEGLVMEKVLFVKEDKKIIYEARFLYFSKSDFDLEDFKSSLTQSLISEMQTAVKTDNSFKGMINKNIIFEYVYLDSQFEEIARVKILINDPVTAVD
jgi:hypothetical protein